VFFWVSILCATVNGTANLIVWWTTSVEVVPPFIRGAAACAGLFIFSSYLLLMGGGLTQLRGSTSALRIHDTWRIVVFAIITILPFFIWGIRHNIAAPIGQERLSGWIAAIQLTALFVGVILVSERAIGIKKALQAQTIAVGLHENLAIPFSSIRYVQAVLIGAWELEPENRFVRIDKIDAASLRESRSEVYTDSNLLNYFQETVLTRFYEPAALATLQPVRTFSKRKTDSIRILDIGGGEGVATINLILQIVKARSSPFKAIEIDVYEASDLADRYAANIASAFPDCAIVRMRGLYDETSHLEQYDLIILMHSLYSLFDMTRSQISMEDQVASLKGRLDSCLNSDGIIVGSLASETGVSASFKRKCMMEAFGRTIQDVTFEEVVRYWRPAKAKTVDGFFKFVGDENGRVARNLGNAWIRYFARLTVDWLNPAQEKYLFQHLVIRCVGFKDLTEQCQAEIAKFDPLHEERLDRTQFLPHKTGVFVSVKE
jgi:hypothetical protein